jgi:hypothetical protein
VFLVCFWCVSDKNTKNTQMRAKTDIKTQPHSNFKWVFIPAFLLWSFYINVTGENQPRGEKEKKKTPTHLISNFPGGCGGGCPCLLR